MTQEMGHLLGLYDLNSGINQVVISINAENETEA
jgi:hypothetical protein